MTKRWSKRCDKTWNYNPERFWNMLKTTRTAQSYFLSWHKSNQKAFLIHPIIRYFHVTVLIGQQLCHKNMWLPFNAKKGPINHPSDPSCSISNLRRLYRRTLNHLNVWHSWPLFNLLLVSSSLHLLIRTNKHSAPICQSLLYCLGTFLISLLYLICLLTINNTGY